MNVKNNNTLIEVEYIKGRIDRIKRQTDSLNRNSLISIKQKNIISLIDELDVLCDMFDDIMEEVKGGRDNNE